MDKLITIIAEIIGYATGKQANEALDKGGKTRALIFLAAFLLLVFGMGAYSIYWLVKTLN